MTAGEPDAGALADPPPRVDTVAAGLDHAVDHVAGHDRHRAVGPPPFCGEDVAVAEPAGLDMYPYMPWRRLMALAFDRLELPPTGDGDGTVGGRAHDGSPVPACSRAMWPAYQSGRSDRSGSFAPLRTSCSPYAAARSGVEPPAQRRVEVLGAVDVRDRQHDDFTLHFHDRSSCSRLPALGRNAGTTRLAQPAAGSHQGVSLVNRGQGRPRVRAAPVGPILTG